MTLELGASQPWAGSSVRMVGILRKAGLQWQEGHHGQCPPVPCSEFQNGGKLFKGSK